MASDRPDATAESLRKLNGNGAGKSSSDSGSFASQLQPRFADEMDDVYDQLWVRIQRRLAGAVTHEEAVTEEDVEIRHHSIQSLIVTSWLEDEGASTVAVGLAARAAASSSGSICLVDADFQRPGPVTAVIGPNAPGLLDLLEGSKSLDQVLVRVPQSSLWYLPTGKVSGRELVTSEARVQEIIAELEGRFRYVFFDAASLKHGVEAYRFGRFVVNTILVVRAGHGKRQTVSHAVDSMRLQGLRVLGTILNRRVDAIPAWLYPYL